MSELKREILFRPAFDKRSKDPKKNYGVHGVDMTWYLTGPLGIIQFVVFTGWMLPHVEEEVVGRVGTPLPADIGYHSPTPMYDGQDRMDCALLPQGFCYYDGSGLRADQFWNILVSKGGEAVWKALEKEYAERFQGVTA